MFTRGYWKELKYYQSHMPHGAAYNQSLPNLTQHTKFSTRTIRTLKICRQSCIILHTNAPMHANMHTKNNLHADKTIINDHVIHIHSFTDRSRHTYTFIYIHAHTATYIHLKICLSHTRKVCSNGWTPLGVEKNSMRSRLLVLVPLQKVCLEILYWLVWNVWIILTYIGNVIIPTDFHSIIFQRGRYTTNQYKSISNELFGLSLGSTNFSRFRTGSAAGISLNH